MTTTDTTTATDLTNNPLMQRAGLPAFDAIQPAHILPGVEASLAEAAAAFEQLEAHATPTWDGLLKPMEAIERIFQYCWAPVGHLMAVKNSDELREAYMAAQPKVVQLGLRMSQSKAIYEALVSLKDSDEWDQLDGAQQRIVESKIRDMQLSGVALEGAAKARFTEIEERLSALSTEFSNHVLDATKAFELIVTDPADAEGWTTTLRAMASQSYNDEKSPDVAATSESGPWRVTLDGPCVSAFMQHSRNRAQREQVYRAFVSRASSGDLDNGPLIAETLKLRQEKAALLGYANHAEVSLATKMAGTVEAVEQMFDGLVTAAKPGMVQDLAQLQAFAQAQGQDDTLMHWDFAFWAERLRELTFAYTDEQLRPYFPLPRVLDGLFGVCQKLFDVTFEREDAVAPRWHDDVQFYNVLNGQGQAIASFYFDPYSRPADKRGGAWVNGCVSRCLIDGQAVNPVYHIICNGTNPTDDKPSLMSFNEVITLFHEFGHALQGMLTTVDYASAAGLSGIEWDAVEICSQFMENWCYDKPTLQGMTEHVETGETLPDDLFEKLRQARAYRAGSGFMRQLCFATMDMTLHASFDPSGDQTYLDIYRSVAKMYEPMPPLEEDNFPCAFEHIFSGGYAAGYYSYKWSEVLSADCFGAFEEVGLENEAKVAELGKHFKQTFLERGGSEHPMAVFKAFVGREPSTEALLRHNGLA